jgi:hypothetical protein
MSMPDIRISRISKLLVDRDETPFETALERRHEFIVTLRCGDDLAQSYTLQLAVLTAANIAIRCFPGAVRIALGQKLAGAPLLLWPSLKQTLGQALVSIIGPGGIIAEGGEMPDNSVVFGNAASAERALRVTFDGWIAKVGPAAIVARLPEREYCPLAGILAAALAISELFLAFAEVNIEARRRTLALSLWRPDLPVCDPAALGISVQFLPREFWTLGLGHLGNGYLWAAATLPYVDPAATKFFLNDFDTVEHDNVETSLLLNDGLIGECKTRACAGWLETRGFRTRLIERPFDGNFRRREDEPGLALCGFDSNPARRDLATARFLRIVESGLGGTPNNFDTISLHTFPNPRPAAELWPDLPETEAAKRIREQERVARENAVYARMGGDDCGRYDLAGKSIAVPFVGTTAATLVVAETLRLFHGGAAYTDIKLAMSALNARAARTSSRYLDQDAAGIRYCLAKPL